MPIMDSIINFLLISAIIIIIIPKISCQNPTCGNNTFFIQYPFLLLQENQKPDHHFNQEFILKCNKWGLAVLNLPFSGDFYVRNIDYFEQKIQLYDPGNCLPARLMTNFSLSASSPFWAVNFKNYTFFRCHSKNLTGFLNDDLSAVGCLSNSTASVMATSLVPRNDREIVTATGCKVIVNLQIPDFDYENNGFRGDLVLAWNDPTCGGDCKGTSHSRAVVNIIIICLITISTGILGALFCLGFCLRLMGKILEIDRERTRRPRYRTRPQEIARPAFHPPQTLDPNQEARTSGPNTSTGPQARNDSSVGFSPEAPGLASDFEFTSYIEELIIGGSHLTSDFEFTSYTEELIIGGSQWISGPNSDSCPICLEEYQASDRLRRVCKCDHCFHARCLEMWLQRKSSCPVCRISVN